MFQNLKLVDIKTFKKIEWIIAGNYKSKFHGSWIEFKDLKEYSFWDEIRNIDWLSSAKTGKTLTRKYEEERDVTTYFLLDIGESMYFSWDKKTKLETLFETFLILAFSSLKNNDKIWAYLFNSEITKIFEPKKWKENLYNIIDNLVKIKGNPTNKEWKINTVLEKMFKSQIKNSFIFVITDNIDNIEQKYLNSLSHKNNLIYINIFDDFENNLTKDWIYKLVNNKNIFVLNTKSEQKRNIYIQKRKEKIDAFKKQVFATGSKYIHISDRDNVYKELFRFFKS